MSARWREYVCSLPCFVSARGDPTILPLTWIFRCRPRSTGSTGVTALTGKLYSPRRFYLTRLDLEWSHLTQLFSR